MGMFLSKLPENKDVQVRHIATRMVPVRRIAIHPEWEVVYFDWIGKRMKNNDNRPVKGAVCIRPDQLPMIAEMGQARKQT